MCADLTGSTSISGKKWSENYLNCGKCKRKLMLFIGDFFLKNYYNNFLRDHQKLYIVGGLKERYLTLHGLSQWITTFNQILHFSAMQKRLTLECQEDKKHQNSCIVSRNGCLHDWHNIGMSTTKRCHSPN